jgi:hypothetical protein
MSAPEDHQGKSQCYQLGILGHHHRQPGTGIVAVAWSDSDRYCDAKDKKRRHTQPEKVAVGTATAAVIVDDSVTDTSLYDSFHLLITSCLTSSTSSGVQPRLQNHSSFLLGHRTVKRAVSHRSLSSCLTYQWQCDRFHIHQ